MCSCVVGCVAVRCGEEDVRRGSLCNKRTRFATIHVTAESSGCLKGWTGVFGSDQDITQIADIDEVDC